MLRGNESDLQHVVELNAIPPIEFVHLGEAKRCDKSCVAVGRKYCWGATLPEPSQRRDVQVIVVIVTEKNGVDGRQILERHAGLANTLGPIRRNGLTRSDQTGSVRIVTPSI